MKVLNLLRENIKQLSPYSSARDEYSGVEGVFLDANENPIGSTTAGAEFNRYPDPIQWKLKQKIAKLKSVSPEQIFLGNGSDEAIDLLVRMFCEPKKDNIIILPPTYGMYKVCADIQDIEIRKVNLIPEIFQIDVNKVLGTIDSHSKIIWVCSPNNPTGNDIKASDIELLLKQFDGVVVVDEAYIDFTDVPSFVEKLSQYDNLVILQTFSKAWGLAALRMGMAFANPELITIFNKVKYPYNINEATQTFVMNALTNEAVKNKHVEEMLATKDVLEKALLQLSFVQKTYPSSANFILVKVDDPRGIYEYLIKDLIIIRDRSQVVLCEGCLRISIGTVEENKLLIKRLYDF